MGCRLKSVGVIDAKVNKGQPKPGTEEGPRAIREAGLNSILSKLKDVGVSITTYDSVVQPEADELEVIENCKNLKAFLSTTAELEQKVDVSSKQNEMTLILGGDHSLGTGAVAGHCKAFPDNFVVWVDAHPDINTPEASMSKNTHGMPLSFVVDEVNKIMLSKGAGIGNIKPALSASQLIYIGLRDIDVAELTYIKMFGILEFDMSDVRALGIETVMDLILQYMEKTRPKASIHLSFDIDSLDPVYAPSTGTPVLNGLTLEEGKYICQRLADTRRLKSMAVVEVNPKLGSEEDAKITTKSAVDVIKSALLID